MNDTVKDILGNYLMHYGMPRRSGRYPWGSGENPYQHEGDFISRVDSLRSEGFTWTDENGKTYTGDTAIAKSMGLSTTQFRTEMSLCKDERRAYDVAQAKSLKAKGYSNVEIAKEMGFNNESSVRSLLNPHSEARMNQAKNTAEFLKKQVDEKGMVDVGTGVELELGVSKEKLKEALYILEKEGYVTYGGRMDQVTNPGKKTTLKVLCAPGTEHREIFDKQGDIQSVTEYASNDDGETFKTFKYPSSMDSSRLAIRYAEDGGIDKDGVIEIRRGVDDLSLGESHYAQVRILVDGNKYLKGMAMYSDNMPPGVDVVFNTNKSKNTSKLDCLKDIKKDPDNPFGALVKANGQYEYTDSKGEKKLGLINKTREEGDWKEWSDSLPSQFLSKQSMQLINKQLNLASSDKKEEFDTICSLTNPTVKKNLLKSFADECDYASVHLQAAALPRQKYQVILPLTSIKDTEVYAPNYNDGETVALIRYPHGGTFEIPILKVNNKQAEGKKVLGNSAADAIGISSKVAERLSGADFDGDTVMVIPCNSSTSKVRITSTPALEGLKGFDPKMEYGTVKKDTGKIDAKGEPIYDYYNSAGNKIKVMKNTQTEMGVISNLITDMTLKGASEDELARAVRHSMVVIDAEKHHLDYKQSEVDNNIKALKKAYQAHEKDDKYGGAATLLSKAKSEYQVTRRQGSPRIDPETGEQTWKTVDDPTYTVTKTNARTGETTTVTKTRTQPSTQMAETKDAHTLSSGTPQEEAYAEYANQMKALANAARKEMVNAGKIEYSASAKTTYQEEVKSLESKLKVALKNAPKERQAQVIANSVVKAKMESNPDMSKKEIKKESQRALTAARNQVGAKRESIEITDKEWEAIQSGAISENTLTKILNNTDVDKLKERAMPRSSSNGLSNAKINQIKALAASGYTNAEIAKRLGISSSTVSNYLK